MCINKSIYLSIYVCIYTYIYIHIYIYIYILTVSDEHGLEKSYILRFWLFACSFRLFAYSFGQDFGLRLGCFGCFGCLVVCLNSLALNIYCLCVFGPSG